MATSFRLKIAILLNRFRRRNGPSLADQCARVIMRMCALQLERQEVRELAPAHGAIGPMLLSGGAITSVTYRVFDSEADQVDKAIRLEPWRAFAEVTMRLALERDPEFEVRVELIAPLSCDQATSEGTWASVEPRACHKAPGLTLVKHLSEYFPLLPRPHTGPIIKPVIEAVK